MIVLHKNNNLRNDPEYIPAVTRMLQHLILNNSIKWYNNIIKWPKMIKVIKKNENKNEKKILLIIDRYCKLIEYHDIHDIHWK